MKPETEYKLRERIKHLERQNRRLRLYRDAVLQVYDGITGMDNLGSGLSVKWVLGKLRQLISDQLD